MVQHHPAPAKVQILLIDRDTVESGEERDVVDALYKLMGTPELVRATNSTVEIVFDGYGHDEPELYHIPAVRQFVSKLHAKFPYWFHACSKVGDGLFIVIMCLLPESANKRANGHVITTIEPGQLSKLLLELFGAANALHARSGITREENSTMTAQVQEYFNSFRQ